MTSLLPPACGLPPKTEIFGSVYTPSQQFAIYNCISLSSFIDTHIYHAIVILPDQIQQRGDTVHTVLYDHPVPDNFTIWGHLLLLPKG